MCSSDLAHLEIETMEDFRERRMDSGWIADFEEFCRSQWADFDYKLSDGETLNEVQRRNIRALNAVLARYDGKNIVIGSHGTALSVIINHFDRSFGYAQFQQIRNLMPWVVRFAFEDGLCRQIQPYNLLAPGGAE